MSDPAVALGVCAQAVTDDERAAHFAVRRRVFVDEQGLFEESDVDARDSWPSAVHLIGSLGGAVCGAVRLYRLPDDDPLAEAVVAVHGSQRVWQGDRLAVLSAHRRENIGAPLVRLAVRTAGERGGTIMVARIQVPNVRFFARLGWRVLGEPVPFVGRAHQTMVIPLAVTSGAAAVL